MMMTWKKEASSDADLRATLSTLYVTLSKVRGGLLKDEIFKLLEECDLAEDRLVRSLAKELRPGVEQIARIREVT